MALAQQVDLVARFLDGEVEADQLPPPQWGPIGEAVYRRTYRRDNETWGDTVKRIVIGNINYAPDVTLPYERERLFDLIYNFKAIPAGRHLWVTGTAASRFNRNCWVSGWSRRTSDHFAFTSARLFEGGGVGSNYSSDLLAVTSPITTSIELLITIPPDHADYRQVKDVSGDSFVELNTELNSKTVIIHVDDSREGWSDVWRSLIDIATSGKDTESVMLDLSAIRSYGQPLRTFGGRASGPEPLARASVAIVKLLNQIRATGIRRINGLEAMAIDHEIAASVVAGGARRSARMSLMHWQDPQIFTFIRSKENVSDHWSTNISVEIDEEFDLALRAADPHAEAVLAAVARGMLDNGEPGLVDTSLHSIGERTAIRMVNPCGEASLSAEISPNGDAAGESCNLGSVNLEAFGEDADAAKDAFVLMARFLYRSTQHTHISSRASRIEQINRRIGVGFFGLQGWAASHGVRLSELPTASHLFRLLDEFRQVTRLAADEIADQLGTPRPIKVTAVAPTGTIAQLAGTTPGVHPVYATHFIRRVRYANSDPNLEIMKREGYRIVPDIYAANTSVVEIPTRDSILDRYPADLIEDSADLSLSSFIELLVAVQSSFCAGSDGQAVSATASIDPSMEVTELISHLQGAIGRLKGITVFPAMSRPLAPYERITSEEWEDLAWMRAVSGDSNDGACIGGACPVR